MNPEPPTPNPHPRTGSPPNPRPRAWTLLVGFLLLLTVALPACRRTGTYHQNTPDATVQSLMRMIRDGNVHLIPTLIHAEDEHMGRMLDQIGPLLGRLHALSLTVQAKYPDEVEQLLARAAEAGRQQVRRQAAQRSGMDWEVRFQRILADPFGALDEEMGRVAAIYVDDETYALTIDGLPAFGIGVLITQQSDGKWYFQLPTTIPMVGTRLPQTDPEWTTMQAMFKSVANGLEWAERAVQEKSPRSLEEVWGEVMLNVAPNLVIQWALYEKAVEHRDSQPARSLRR